MRRTRCDTSSQVRAGAGWVRVGGSRFLQTDPIPGGSANNYDYAGQDPVNNVDLGGTSYEADGGPASWQETARILGLDVNKLLDHVGGRFGGRAATLRRLKRLLNANGTEIGIRGSDNGRLLINRRLKLRLYIPGVKGEPTMVGKQQASRLNWREEYGQFRGEIDGPPELLGGYLERFETGGGERRWMG